MVGNKYLDRGLMSLGNFHWLVSLLSRHITWLLSQVPRGPSSCGNKAWFKTLPFFKKKHALGPKKQQLHYFHGTQNSPYCLCNYPVFQTVPYSPRWFNEKSTGLVLSTDVIDMPGIIFWRGKLLWHKPFQKLQGGPRIQIINGVK